MKTIAEIREWNEKYGPQQTGIRNVVNTLLVEVDKLTDLIRHMQIHAGYPKCGYGYMTTEQKELFDQLNGME